MGKRELRMNRLVDIVHSCGYTSIKEAAKLLNVSEMTVRRDLAVVEKSGLVKNVNGVLVQNAGQPTNKVYDLESETQVQNEAKALIGHFAAGLIAPGDCIIFDCGTTTEQIARCLSPTLEFEALCFTRNILEHLYPLPKAAIAMAGGYYHPGAQMFTSDEGVAFIQNVRANKVFVSAAGVHESLGISCANSYEVPTKKAILRSAKQHILVADSSKFGVVRSAYFCDLSDIDTVVTDSGLAPEWVTLLESRGITLYRV